MAKEKKSAKEIMASIKNRVVSGDNMATQYVETNCIGFDLGISNGKGLPVGASISMFAPPGCGKTTLCADIIRRLISSHKAKGVPYRVVYVAVEDSKELMVAMGLGPHMDSQDLIYLPGRLSFAELENLYRTILSGEDDYFKDVKLIVVDSITNVLSQKIIDKDCGDGDFGSNAAERGQFYPKYLPVCKEKGITNIFIAQVRVKQGATAYEDPNKPAITDLDKHNMDVIIKFSKTSDSKDKDNKKVTVKTSFGDDEVQKRFVLTMSSSIAKDTKNRYGRIPNVKMLVEFGKQVLNTYTLREMLTGLGYIKVTGTKYKINEDLIAEITPNDEAGLKAKETDRVGANKFVKANIRAIKEFLKMRDQYKLDISTEEDADDGM